MVPGVMARPGKRMRRPERGGVSAFFRRRAARSAHLPTRLLRRPPKQHCSGCRYRLRSRHGSESRRLFPFVGCGPGKIGFRVPRGPRTIKTCGRRSATVLAPVGAPYPAVAEEARASVQEISRVRSSRPLQRGAPAIPLRQSRRHPPKAVAVISLSWPPHQVMRKDNMERRDAKLRAFA
jgi:hypothetical protein